MSKSLIMKQILFVCFLVLNTLKTNASILVVTSLQDSVAGSLRSTLSNAQKSDTIKFNIINSSSLLLLKDELTINKSITINGINLFNKDTLTIKQTKEYTKAINIPDGNNNITMMNLKITNGYCTYWPSLGLPQYAQSGGICIGKNNIIYLCNCTVFKNNSSNYNAGGISVSTNARLTMDNCVVSNNFGFCSGGIVTSSPITIRNCRIINNSTQSGTGGICVTGSELKISNTMVCNNSGSGIILRDNGKLSMENCKVNQNGYATSGDNGICGYSSLLNISNSEICNNNGGDGAGIHSTYKLILKKSNISNNYSINDYGGIYCTGEVLIDSCNIDNNTSYNNAGGIYIINVIRTATIPTISNSKITNNTVTNGFAGGLYSFGRIYIYNNYFSNNKALEAGAMYVTSTRDTVEIINNTIEGNKVTKNGGGIFLNLYLYSGTDINGNNYKGLIPRADLLNNTIVGNRTNGKGAGIYYQCYDNRPNEYGIMNIYNNIVAYNYSNNLTDNIYKEIDSDILQGDANITTISGSTEMLNTTPINYSYNTSIFNNYTLSNSLKIPLVTNTGTYIPYIDLSENSLAIGHGVYKKNGINIPKQDQRGLFRNNPPTLGSIEFNGINSIIRNTYSTNIKINVHNQLLELSNLPSKSKVSIYNLLGSMIYNAEFTSSTIDIQLKSGFYIVLVDNVYVAKVNI